jgi:HEAT repeat protein
MAATDSYTAVVERMGDPDAGERWKAFAELMHAGPAATTAVLHGLSNPDWRVRRGCALYADHHPEPELLERLRLALTDPKAKVRLMAVHGLACEPCKPGGNPIDPVPLLIRALKDDRALRVRRHAANMLCQQPGSRRITRAFRWSLEHETDAKLLRAINRGLRQWAAQPAAG